MWEYVRAHKLTTTICLSTLFLVGCWPNWPWSLAAPSVGRIAAHRDIQRGRYQLLGYGLPSPSRPEYARCLRERYGIQFHAVAGCIVSESLVSYVNAYDSTLEEAARKRFGRNVFSECADEADTKWKAQREASAQSTEVRQ